MKKINLIERLLSNSHEKQKPQRFGRYAAILIMLLTLGVGQMWADWSDNYVTFYVAVGENHTHWGNDCRKFYSNIKRGDNDWEQIELTRTGYTYNGKTVYQGTHNFGYGGYNNWQFYIKDGSGNNQKYIEWYAGSWKSDFHSGQVWDWTGTDSGDKTEDHWKTATWDSPYTIYFANVNDWGTVKAYAWNGYCDNNAAHPGTAMEATDCYSNGHRIYKITFDKRYSKVQINDGGNTNKYDNQDCYSNAGKILIPGAGDWWQTIGPSNFTNYSISSGATVVWDAGNESWTTAQIYYYKPNYDAADNLTRCGTSTQFYKTYAAAWSNYAGIVFRKDDSWSAKTTNITRDNSGVTLYTYCNSNTSGKLDWQVTTSAKKATSGVKIYFDNTDAQWNEIWLRYGTTWFVRSSAAAATQVTGTENLYVLSIPNDAYW